MRRHVATIGARIRVSAFAIRAMRLAGDVRGVAAVEFALILPLLVTLFFGELEISDLLTVNRRVVTSVNALTDLVTQERDLTTAEIDSIMLGARQTISPNAGSTLTFKVTSVIRNPNNANQLIVVWSRDSQGGTPYAANSVFTKIHDVTLVNPGASLVVGEVQYNYVSSLMRVVTPMTKSYSELVTRWPRRSDQVVICGASPLPACVD